MAKIKSPELTPEQSQALREAYGLLAAIFALVVIILETERGPTYLNLLTLAK